jgi:hypothetical protein
MGMLKIARSGFSASRLSSEQARSSPQALLRCRAIGAHVYDGCSQALRSFAFQANTQFSTLRYIVLLFFPMRPPTAEGSASLLYTISKKYARRVPAKKSESNDAKKGEFNQRMHVCELSLPP